MKTLYIVRHGETDWNKMGKYQGITDVPLNENGLNQAKACGQALKDCLLYTSVAGALHIRLGGYNQYFKKMTFREYMGDPIEKLNRNHITRTIYMLSLIHI